MRSCPNGLQDWKPKFVKINSYPCNRRNLRLLPFPYTFECRQRAIENRLIHCGGDLSTKPCFAIGDDGIPEAFDIDAFVEERVAHVHCDRCFAEHDGND